jgi:hypothetical protein
MATPMIDLPEHFPMALNAQGQGPETRPEYQVGWVCWCQDGAHCVVFVEYLRHWGGQ